MMIEIPTYAIVIATYWLIVGALILAQTVTIGYAWQRNEFARRAVGIGTVMLFGLIPVAAGLSGWLVWLAIVGAFVIAAIVLGTRHITDDNARASRETDEAQSEIDRANHEQL